MNEEKIELCFFCLLSKSVENQKKRTGGIFISIPQQKKTQISYKSIRQNKLSSVITGA